MNIRQQAMLRDLTKEAKRMQLMYERFLRHKEMWEEEFKTNKDNAMDTPDLTDQALDYTDLNKFVTKVITRYVDFWDGAALTAELETGKFARRIMEDHPNP